MQQKLEFYCQPALLLQHHREEGVHDCFIGFVSRTRKLPITQWFKTTKICYFMVSLVKNPMLQCLIRLKSRCASYIPTWNFRLGKDPLPPLSHRWQDSFPCSFVTKIPESCYLSAGGQTQLLEAILRSLPCRFLHFNNRKPPSCQMLLMLRISLTSPSSTWQRKLLTFKGLM